MKGNWKGNYEINLLIKKIELISLILKNKLKREGNTVKTSSSHILSKYILRPKLSLANWLKSVEFALYFLTFAQRKFKCKVKLNFGLGPDFSVQLKVSLSESLSERLSQKLKLPNA